MDFGFLLHHQKKGTFQKKHTRYTQTNVASCFQNRAPPTKKYTPAHKYRFWFGGWEVGRLGSGDGDFHPTSGLESIFEFSRPPAAAAGPGAPPWSRSWRQRPPRRRHLKKSAQAARWGGEVGSWRVGELGSWGVGELGGWGGGSRMDESESKSGVTVLCPKAIRITTDLRSEP